MREAYDQLIDALNMRGGAVASYKCDELYALLKAMFTPEEAALCAKMPPMTSSAEDIAAAGGTSMEQAMGLLESMANKGLVVYRDKNGRRLYAPLPVVPGFFEFQFMKGTTTERDKELARLFDNYFKVLRDMPRESAKLPGVPFARVITVEEEIPAGTEVFAYDQVSEYIDKAEHITVSACYCRHHGELVGNPCDKPKNNCMSFGPSAKFVADRGFGRLISKEEARDIIKQAEEAGLVHCSSNTSKYIDFICNCCDCHCGIVQSLKAQQVHFGATSSFMAEVDAQECIACEECIERCPMDALSIEDDVAKRDASKCIGCGLCVSVCSTGAIQMVEREEKKAPPADHRELMTSMIASMQ
ncbi:DUF362 domain-containing protein [Thermodesulfobacteriota bacterium]